MKNNEKKKRILIILSVLFILVIPAILIVTSATWLGRTWIRPEVEEEVTEYVIPTEILADKIKYKDEFLVVRGRVLEEDVVCERIDCPSDDPCCGCKDERNLVITDVGSAIITQMPGKLVLSTPEEEAFCHRRKNSCEFECPDWRPGGIYEIKGIFRATPPPIGSGLKIYFGYYLEVHEKKLVRGVGFIEKITALFNGLKNIIASSRTSGYYILH